MGQSSTDLQTDNNRMDQFEELTNNIYDSGILGKEGFIAAPHNVILSLMVTMLPKVVPLIMPEIISRVNPDASSSRFDEDNYKYEMETMFRNKFADNLMMVVDILNEEKVGQKVERSGEEGRLARLITTTLDTVGVDISDFDGSKMVDLADLVSGRSPRSAMYNLAADTIISVLSNVLGMFWN